MFPERSQVKDGRAVVVGAGLGGLSAAAYLAKNGFEVDLFERNDHPGGYASSFVRGRFEFEASLHELSGIGPEANRGACYKTLEGCDVARRVEFIPIDDFYTSIFPDFTVTIPYGWEAAEEAYCGQFPGERDGIHRLLGFMRDVADEIFSMSGKTGPLDLLTFPVRGFKVIRSIGLTLEQVVDRELKDPRLKALFCNIWGYYGLPPSRLSFMLFAVGNASYLEYGPCHVKGTSQALSNAFVEAIEENGGTVHLGNGVNKITVSGRKVTGVVTDEGGEIPAEFIVSNANPIHACYKLIGAENVPAGYLKALAERRIAMSTLNVYLGLDCTAEELGSEHYEVSVNGGYDIDETYRRMFSLERPLSYGLTNYNVMNPDFSPPGTCVVVLTAAADYKVWTRVPPDRYVDTKNRIAAEMIDAAEEVLPGLSSHIEVVEVSTPITNMRYTGNPGGSILGFDFSVTGNPILRLSNRGPLEGLYFANAWVRMGGGMETCIHSGLLAFSEIMKDVKGVKGPAKYLPSLG